MGVINYLVTDIIQNIFLCVHQKKKLIQVWNNMRMMMMMSNGSTIPLSYPCPMVLSSPFCK